MEKLLIIDSLSIMNRAYFALPPMFNLDGTRTNAIYGYISMLNKLKEEIPFDHIVATFDSKGPTFRHDEYGEYKAGRKPMDEELAQQIPIMKELLEAYSITIVEKSGYEADDLIGTIACQAEKEGIEPYILSGDKDTLQLATDITKVVITKKGITEKVIYDKDSFIEEFGVTPTQYIDVKALMGDKSDNIPGVPGVGEKTAFQLIKDYGSIEGIYENIENMKKSKVKENLIEHQGTAYFSRKLATIMCDAPAEIDLDKIKDNSRYDLEKIRELYLKLQFKSLLAKLNTTENNNKKESKASVESKEPEQIGFSDLVDNVAKEKSDDGYSGAYTEIDNAEKMHEVANIIKENPLVSLSFSYHPDTMLSKREIDNIYLTVDGAGYMIDFSKAASDAAFIEGMRLVFENEKIKKFSYDVKNAYTVMKKHGINFNKVDFDVLVATYLLEPTKGQYSLKELIGSYLLKNINESGNKQRIIETGYLEELTKVLKQKIEEADLNKLLYEVELPLTNVLSDMEMEGIKVDINVLNELGDKFNNEMEKVSKEIYELADETFNINSPKQLGVILFDKLDLPHGRKIKTGWSTDQEVLDSLMDLHPIVEKVQYYRQLKKMYSTYVEGLRNAIDVDSKIHSNFNQTLAVTGRLSSTEPNLQNIPIKYEMGRELRKAFIPSDDDSMLLSSDYSQIELRVLAHIANDKNMQDAFISGIDIHTKTASEVFGKKPEDVTSRDRSNAKAVNFGIVYGIGEFALGNDLKISRKEAREYIDKYYDRYPDIKNYFENVKAEAKETGMVKTIFNRRRQIPEINASNRITQAAGVRLAMNSPIQGSAADIIKVAMVKVHDALIEEKLESRMILQVHDEIIINMKKDEEDKVVEIVNREMENAVKLDVTLKSEQSIGKNWFEA